MEASDQSLLKIDVCEEGKWASDINTDQTVMARQLGVSEHFYSRRSCEVFLLFVHALTSQSCQRET